MIILHNLNDTNSRLFVEKYGNNEDSIILTYPECLKSFPNVSSYPSIVISIPAYYSPETIIPGLLNEDGTKSEDEIIPGCNVTETIELFRNINEDFNPDEFYNSYLERLNYVNKRALESPFKKE